MRQRNILRRAIESARTLDACWWDIGGAGMSFPSVRRAKQLPPEPIGGPRRGPGRHGDVAQKIRFNPADRQRYLDELRIATEEYERWIEGKRRG